MKDAINLTVITILCMTLYQNAKLAKEFKEEAIKRNCAEYVVNKNGIKHFEWKSLSK